MSGTIRIEGKNLIFEIHGIDIILAIRKSITIPLDHVASVSTDKISWEAFQQLRVIGSSIPGVVKDGMFLSKDGLLFFEMHDPDKCITVSLKNDKYKKIIFEVQDKESATKTIRDAMFNN